MTNNTNEIEVKISVPATVDIPNELQKLGFKGLKSRIFEVNTTFDSEDRHLRRNDQLLRLRQVPGRAIVTWKGRSETGPHKSRPEIESEVSSAENVTRIFKELGFMPRFRYEKYRTEFQREPEGVVTYDETPIGQFLELEGAPEWIDKTAAELGFSAADYRLESYGELYRQHCELHGQPVADMIFPTA